MSDQKKTIETEFESLNLDNLDVEELEHRLEMAMSTPNVTTQELEICGVNGQDACYINA
jgi:hypothetical protein